MSITLESEPCPHCLTENSIHIDTCRSCGKTLPWAGTEQTKVLTEPVVKTKPPIKRSKIIFMFVVGGLMVTIGGINFVYTLLTHRPPSGWLWVIVGTGLCGYANNLLMNIDEMPK